MQQGVTLSISTLVCHGSRIIPIGWIFWVTKNARLGGKSGNHRHSGIVARGAVQRRGPGPESRVQGRSSGCPYIKVQALF